MTTEETEKFVEFLRSEIRRYESNLKWLGPFSRCSRWWYRGKINSLKNVIVYLRTEIKDFEEVYGSK